jgi:hypothetical protein
VGGRRNIRTTIIHQGKVTLTLTVIKFYAYSREQSERNSL